MRIFVVGTGRSGTCSFYQAARTLVGYTAGHESTAGVIPSWEYPDNHVEVSSQLVYGIPRLRAKYPDARWVHLVRERGSCVESLARQCWGAMEAFALQWFQARHPVDVMFGAGQFYDLTNELIEALLPDARRIPTEQIREEWPEFCRWIGAEWDRAAATEILQRKYNPGVNRGRDNFLES